MTSPCSKYCILRSSPRKTSAGSADSSAYAQGAPGLPAGPAWIYLIVTGSAALLMIAVTRLPAARGPTAPVSSRPTRGARCVPSGGRAQ
jgi:hypothetical protein